MCNQDHNDWDEKIDTILMGYRASSQASTKHSPYLFQKEMRLPIDNEIIPIGNIIEEGDLDKTMEILLQKKKELFQKVESNIKISQQKQKETYDRKHLPKELAPGTEILIENTARLANCHHQDAAEGLQSLTGHLVESIDVSYCIGIHSLIHS